MISEEKLEVLQFARIGHFGLQSEDYGNGVPRGTIRTGRANRQIKNSLELAGRPHGIRLV